MVKLKGYDFFFCREPQEFVPDQGFAPFFWKRKGDDTGMMARGKARMGMMLPLVMLRRHLLLWMLISLRLVIPPPMANMFPLVLEAALELLLLLRLPLLIPIW
jgi:hypothetical protein